jgi:2-iminobutanoate/2-iminopropanoate deaminase
MAKKVVKPVKAPKPLGPYSQAVKAGGFVFVSGQIPVMPETGQVVVDDVAAATEQCIRNVAAVLEDAGLSLDDVVSTTVFLKDMADFPRMNEVYGKFFGGAPPARATVQVGALPKGARVEIQVIAAEK